MKRVTNSSTTAWGVFTDPTQAREWHAHRARGYAPFLVLHGVLPIGIPIAILLDVGLLVHRHDLPLFLSAVHAIQLGLLTLVVGIPAGLLAGRILWRLGERRAADELLTRAFDISREDATEVSGNGRIG